MKFTPIQKTMLIGSAAIAGGVAAAAVLRRRPIDLHGKVVVITGGSRGLGLGLARAFAEQGCRLVLCARSLGELRVAADDVRETGAEVLTVDCDVARRDDVDRLIEEALARFGQIDVLVNNAGMIMAGPVETMTVEDFEQAMGVMFWGMVYTTLAVLPHMRPRGSGRIVNITSIGGKVSVPHLLPYNCAKFAAVAFSEGMRAELARSGIRVVTIAPGLMRTGSYVNALFKGQHESEAAWFSAGATLPGISISAARAVTQIVDATRRGSAERILGLPANLLVRFHGLFPGITADALGVVNRLLPRGGSRQAVRGADTSVVNELWRAKPSTLQPHVSS